MKKKLLWVDDEIELLKPYFIFLESKNYHVETCSNGNDAIDMVRNTSYDVVLLDEMMPGKDGLTTLEEMKDIDPSIKVIMVTKSEEESIMEEAIGHKIDDYLIKPVNPSQVLLSLKKTLESKDINSQRIQDDYLRELQEIRMNLMNHEYGDSGWIKLHEKLSQYAIKLDELNDATLNDTFLELKKEANAQFSDYVGTYYEEWVHTTRDDRPKLSVDILKEDVVPKLKAGEQVIFIVLDCLRLDHWYVLEQMLQEDFRIETESFYSIVPTTTAYARNAIFSGKYPDEFAQMVPGFWDRNENELNRDEVFFAEQNLGRNGIKGAPYYIKCNTNEDILQLNKSISSVFAHDFSIIIVNTIDIMTHSRAESSILKELVPNDASYRRLMESWLKSSALYQLFQLLKTSDHSIVLTTDHGSIQCKRDVKINGDKDTSSNLRFKHGRSLTVPKKFAAIVKDPHRFKLPHRGFSSDYIIGKEDYYFIYPTSYNKFASQYDKSYQHGGISLDEMVIPVAHLKGKS